jgi:hypothetical protein
MTREEFLKELHHPIDLRKNGMKVIIPSMEKILKKRREEAQKNNQEVEEDIEK